MTEAVEWPRDTAQPLVDEQPNLFLSIWLMGAESSGWLVRAKKASCGRSSLATVQMLNVHSFISDGKPRGMEFGGAVAARSWPFCAASLAAVMASTAATRSASVQHDTSVAVTRSESDGCAGAVGNLPHDEPILARRHGRGRRGEQQRAAASLHKSRKNLNGVATTRNTLARLFSSAAPKYGGALNTPEYALSCAPPKDLARDPMVVQEGGASSLAVQLVGRGESCGLVRRCGCVTHTHGA